MGLFCYLMLMLRAAVVSCKDELTAPTIERVTMIEPIPLANWPGRDTLRLECIASGSPDPVIEWSFNGAKLYSSDDSDTGDNPIPNKVTVNGNRLTIYNVKGKSKYDPDFYNSGRYRCIAINSMGAVFLEKNLQIRVMGIFRPGYGKNDDSMKWHPIVGRGFAISCPPHSIGYGTEYRWGIYLPGSDYLITWFWLPGEKNKKMFYTRDGTLVWSVISHEDIYESREIGGLRCFLTNLGQIQASNKQLLWQPYDTTNEEMQPALVSRLPAVMKVAVDAEYDLLCGAIGNPAPTYHWQYEGKDIVGTHNNSFQLFGNNMVLRIKRITRYSAGTFKCVARNAVGEMSSVGELSVSFPPKWIEKLPMSKIVDLESSFELVCNATGFPKPTYKWFLNMTRITTTENKRRTIAGDKSGEIGSRLIIKKAEYFDAGCYICVARNYLDTLTMMVHVKISGEASTVNNEDTRTYIDQKEANNTGGIYDIRDESEYIHN